MSHTPADAPMLWTLEGSAWTRVEVVRRAGQTLWLSLGGRDDIRVDQRVLDRDGATVVEVGHDSYCVVHTDAGRAAKASGQGPGAG
jgi:hypothetical protein